MRRYLLVLRFEKSVHFRSSTICDDTHTHTHTARNIFFLFIPLYFIFYDAHDVVSGDLLPNKRLVFSTAKSSREKRVWNIQLRTSGNPEDACDTKPYNTFIYYIYCVTIAYLHDNYNRDTRKTSARWFNSYHQWQRTVLAKEQQKFKSETEGTSVNDTRNNVSTPCIISSNRLSPLHI